MARTDWMRHSTCPLAEHLRVTQIMDDVGSMPPAATDLPRHEMGRREQFESLMDLAEFHLSRWRTKNATEWRVAFGTWAVLLASPIYIRNRPSDTFLAIALVVFFVLYSYCWAFSIARKNHFDVNKAFHYKNMAERLISGETIYEFRAEKQWDEMTRAEAREFNSHVWRSPAFWFQIFTTALISILAFVLIGEVGRVL